MKTTTGRYCEMCVFVCGLILLIGTLFGILYSLD